MALVAVENQLCVVDKQNIHVSHPVESPKHRVSKWILTLLHQSRNPQFRSGIDFHPDQCVHAARWQIFYHSQSHCHSHWIMHGAHGSSFPSVQLLDPRGSEKEAFA